MNRLLQSGRDSQAATARPISAAVDRALVGQPGGRAHAMASLGKSRGDERQVLVNCANALSTAREQSNVIGRAIV